MCTMRGVCTMCAVCTPGTFQMVQKNTKMKRPRGTPMEQKDTKRNVPVVHPWNIKIPKETSPWYTRGPHGTHDIPGPYETKKGTN